MVQITDLLTNRAGICFRKVPVSELWLILFIFAHINRRRMMLVFGDHIFNIAKTEMNPWQYELVVQIADSKRLGVEKLRLCFPFMA